MNEIDGLPDYMKTVYRFIMSIYEDHERIKKNRLQSLLTEKQ